MAKEESLEVSIDKLLTNLPLGSVDRAISQSLYGINSKAKNNYLPRAKDSTGYVFFTRPMLNLTADNVSGVRRFVSLLNPDEISYSRYVRMILDPRLEQDKYESIKSPLVNNKRAFIPILTNSITNLSGWPSLELPTYTSEAGLYNQQTAQADGVINDKEVYDLTATFRNTIGSVGIYLFTIWVYYEALVSEGVLNPYVDFIVENEYDYNTRVYRILTDRTNKYVSNIACSGASFPVTIPTGNIFDFNADRPIIDGNADIDIRFRSMGFLFNEEIIMLEFNQTQAIFDPAIGEIIKLDLTTTNKDLMTRNDPSKMYWIESSGYAKVPHHLVSRLENSLENEAFSLNFHMFPYINLNTHELEWWTEKEKLVRFLKGA